MSSDGNNNGNSGTGNLPNPDEMPPGGPGNGDPGAGNRYGYRGAGALRMIDLPIEDELRESYLTYAMSVIV
ncbi:MAG: hypothetical protein ACO1RT_19655, partial [Planctomycetaceae bacterium]